MSEKRAAYFFSNFAVPFVTGGNAQVRGPITFSELQEIEAGLPHIADQTQRIDEERERIGTLISPEKIEFLFGPRDLRVLVVIHNLFFAQHPDALHEDFTLRRRVKKRLSVQLDAMMDSLAPRNYQEVIGRHGLMANLLGTYRMDTTVSWWTGRRKFHGERIPRRLLRWQGLRNVNVDKSARVIFPLLEERLPKTTKNVLSLSPLTMLVDQRAPTDWGIVAGLLRSPTIARFVVNDWLSQPSLRALQMWIGGLVHFVAGQPKADDVKVVVGFLQYVYYWHAVSLSADELERLYQTNDESGRTTLELWHSLPHLQGFQVPEPSVFDKKWRAYGQEAPSPPKQVLEWFQDEINPYVTSEF